MAMATIRFGAILVLAVTACGGMAPLPPTAARAADVAIGKADPPPGAADLGPIEAAHGDGCGGFGETGTFEGAMITLRNEAAARGANYVALVATMSPHLAGGCFDNRFVLQGIAYRVNPDQPPAIPVTGDGCDPPCSPGYRCSRSVCLALCNPACGPDQVCRQDRTCGPAGSAPADR
jgi:hypothetical protein